MLLDFIAPRIAMYPRETAIAEKFHIEALLFPRLMAEIHPVSPGRSTGPFRSAGMFGDTMKSRIAVPNIRPKTAARFYKKPCYKESGKDVSPQGDSAPP